MSKNGVTDELSHYHSKEENSNVVRKRKNEKREFGAGVQTRTYIEMLSWTRRSTADQPPKR
jgi:hypothetical protein